LYLCYSTMIAWWSLCFILIKKKKKNWMLMFICSRCFLFVY
jgi:hypothetical protein